MSLGTLYGSGKTRAILPVGLVKALDLDVALESVDSEAYKAAFPLAKVPAFVGPKGFKLHEVLAVSIYLVSLKDEKSPLLGKNTKEYSQILKWLSFGTSDFLTNATSAFAGLLGAAPYNKKVVDEAQSKFNQHVEVIEQRLREFTYLVGERLTLADLFLASTLYRPFTTFCGTEWRASHPYITRWFNTVSKTPFLSYFFDSVTLADKPIDPPKPQKKEKAKKQPQPQQPKAAKKEAAPAADAEPAEPKKPKHPLEALGKSSIPIDELKRQYSNLDTRTGSLPYFWNEFYNPAEWSLWKVDYKYNDELTLTFMSNNLVGGFFNRLSASTKYLFGCAVVYGENNNNGITGAFLVRGQDALPAFDVAPDYESYAFTKLDASKEEDKAFINNMWAWDEPVVANGEKKVIVDGKVFK